MVTGEGGGPPGPASEKPQRPGPGGPSRFQTPEGFSPSKLPNLANATAYKFFREGGGEILANFAKTTRARICIILSTPQVLKTAKDRV